MMVWPSACTASMRQERTGAPSTITVQAPQTPCSQPTCVPASNKSWRRKSLSNSRDSTLRRYCLSLTLTVIWCVSVVTARALACGCQSTLGENAAKVALEFLAGVNVAARIDGALNQIRGLVDRRGADGLARKRRARVFGQDRRVRRVAQCNPCCNTSFALIELHAARDANKREVAAAPRYFHEAHA